jgi:hypothetical protein
MSVGLIARGGRRRLARERICRLEKLFQRGFIDVCGHVQPVTTGIGGALAGGNVTALIAICDNSGSAVRAAIQVASHVHALTSTTFNASAAKDRDWRNPTPGGCVPSGLPAYVANPDEAAL